VIHRAFPICANALQQGTPLSYQSASKFDPLATGFGGGARAVGAGRGCGIGANAGCRLIFSSALDAPTVVDGLDDIAMVGEVIEQRGCLGITEDALQLEPRLFIWDSRGAKAPSSLTALPFPRGDA
jgi:hypothetical protein